MVALLDEGKTVTLRLRGRSMRPFLQDNRDCALFTRCHHPRVGMAVLAQVEGGNYVFHRIVSIDGDRVTLRGDGNLGVEHCKLNDVLAEPLGFYRKGRTTLERPTGWKWRTYSWVWMRTLRIRRYLLAIDDRVRRLANRMKRITAKAK